jgi:hypothetical protein
MPRSVRVGRGRNIITKFQRLLQFPTLLRPRRARAAAGCRYVAAAIPFFRSRISQLPILCAYDEFPSS